MPDQQQQTGETATLRIAIAENSLRAWIEAPGLGLLLQSPPTEAQLVALAQKSRLLVNEDVGRRLHEYAELIGAYAAAEKSGAEGKPEIPERFLIAEGRAPVEGAHATFEWAPEYARSVQDWQGDDAINYYELNSVVTIEAGASIGRIVRERDGVLGTDVFGKETRPKVLNGQPLKVGNGLKLSDAKAGTIVTEQAGRVVEKDGKLFLDPVLTVGQDVDFSSGNVDSVIDVHIRGTVKPNFVVKSTGAITIESAIESAAVESGGDLQVRRGIFGQDSDYVIRVGGDLTTNICDSTQIEVTGDATVSREIITSRLYIRGQLNIEHGAVVGGEVYARNGAKIKVVGSDLGVETRIAVGEDGAAMYRAQQLEGQVKKYREQAEQIRTTVQPLLANVKRLTPAQREQATELMCKADDVDRTTDDMLAERDRIREDAKPVEGVGLDLLGEIHPGTVVVFGLREVVFKKPLQGPVRIEERAIKGRTQIAVVNQTTGSVTPMPCAPVDVERFKQQDAEQAAGETDGADEQQSTDTN